MRVLVCGLTILGIAVVLLSWDASELPGQRVDPAPVAADPGISLPAREAIGAHPSGLRAKDLGAREFEGSRSGIADSAPTVAESDRPIASSGDLPERSNPDGAKQIVDGSAAGLREPAPGSKGISEAIASSIGSDNSEETVAPVARLYFAYFNRAPDYEGFDYYIDEHGGGRPLDAIAEEFAGSREFEMRYGSVDNAAFIDRVYQNVVGGPADAAQRAYWLGQLDSGSVTRGELMLAFSESAAFRALIGDEVFVTMAYAETLRRAPDPAELLHWLGFLDDGNPRVAVIDGLLAASRSTR